MEKPPQSILFICASLEPGKDGVGDYTRKLACALQQRGHAAAIMAINDRRINAAWKGSQTDNNAAVPVLRLPATLPWPARREHMEAFANGFSPGWVSLQYVPFGFQLKGIPFKLAGHLQSLYKNRRRHIMFHELSVNKNESLKFRLWAGLQVFIIRRLMHTLRPDVVSTNTGIYKARLEKMGRPVQLLPLFSNITRSDVDCTEAGATFSRHGLNRNDYILATLFGSFSYKSWNLHSLLDKFTNSNGSKKLAVTSVGRMSFGEEYWLQLQRSYPHVLFITLGMQTEAFISCWLSHYTDVGILTTLPELASKSGSFMAFKEHGLPVLCKQRTPELDGYNIPLDEALTEVKDNVPFTLPPRYTPVTVLDAVVQQFINDLENSG